ncbi:MAG TPA: helix-turn-helix transcriptional regulator [Gemmatimonadales bacterium]|jgi:DNA-binding NarL/FixJ family response regulator
MVDGPVEMTIRGTTCESGAEGDSTFPVFQHRWVAAVSALTTLRRDSEAILEQIRTSLTKLRALRARLGTVAPPPTANGNGAPEQSRAVYFQLQYGLTPRETQVAMLLAEGRSNEDIASVLRVSPHTARHHTQHVLAKLGVHSRAQAGARVRGW